MVKVRYAGEKEEGEGGPQSAPAPVSVSQSAPAPIEPEPVEQGEEGETSEEKKKLLRKKIAAQSLHSGGFRMPSARCEFFDVIQCYLLFVVLLEYFTVYIYILYLFVLR